MTIVTGPGHNANGHGAGLPPVPSIPLADETPRDVAGEQSVGGLIKDVMTQVSVLLRAEIELAKLELSAEVKKVLRGSVFIIAGITILMFSLFFLFFAIAELLADLGLYRSLSFGIVWFAMLLCAGGLGFLGYRKARQLRAPARTIETIKDTAAALSHPGERS
ncbi:phage holin family protein [Kutzneria buriramensis]|uniref:Putative superfamily III holin-X n=1 Tax=Kutzneria buriramensis TaxID=1045776 RepID=A0A3E0HUE7_9PSEU|nr:phage holin family protein [Kutzneria buriramensis]REH50172.1 putative superfamily III holin-X [Kutzneria buriramensis]